MRALTKKFVTSVNQKFKASVSYHGENLYLLPFGPSTYLFVQTKNNEIIKAIESNTLDVQDIKKRLIASESVGFASYVYMGESYLGIATRILSPRITAFSELMSKVVAGYGGEDYAFIPTILAETLPKNSIKSLDHVGSVTVEMNVANSVAQDVIKQLTNRDADNLVDIAGVEITIRPLRKGKKSLRDDLANISSNIPSKGLMNLEARAKATAADHMTDIFIVGEGGIRDFINFDKESDLQNLIPDRATKNKALQVKVKEYEANVTRKKVNSISDLGINRNTPAIPTMVVSEIPVAGNRAKRLRSNNKAD